MKKHRLCLITVAMMAAGCTTYQHPEPTQAKDALKQAMNDQQKQAAPLTALPRLQQQLVNKQDELTAKQGLMRQLGSLTLQKSQGYASVMADLSRIRNSNLSLQRIEINEGRINLSGFAGRSQDVPAWVNRFKQTPSLVGKEFGELTLSRDKEGRLTFQLSGIAREKP